MTGEKIDIFSKITVAFTICSHNNCVEEKLGPYCAFLSKPRKKKKKKRKQATIVRCNVSKIVFDAIHLSMKLSDWTPKLCLSVCAQ